MIDKIINCLFSLDVIGPTPKLYIFNKERYQSLFSLIISLVIIFVSIIFILYSLINYIKNERPTVLYSKSNDKHEQRRINLNDMLLMFQIIDYNSMKKINESIVHLESIYTAIYDKAKVDFSILNVKKCKAGENLNIKYEKILKEKFNELSEGQIQEDKNIDDFYCINSDKSDISLFYDPNVGYSFINLNIILHNQNIYIPENLSLMIIYENNLINHDDKKSPISEGISYQFVQVFSSEEYYTANLNFQYLKYETDDGLFFDNLKYLKGMSFFDIAYYINNQESYDMKNDFIKYNSSKVGTIMLTLNKSNYDLYRRTYKKLQTLLAEIMSIVSLLFEIGKQISSFLNEKKMSVDIIRKLFNNEKNKINYKFHNFDVRIKTPTNKINSTFKLTRKSSFIFELLGNDNKLFKSKNEKILKQINIINIIKSIFCNGIKDKYISLCNEIVMKDMSVENILERFYNAKRINKSNIDVEKNDLTLYKESKFREINSIINGIYNKMRSSKLKKVSYYEYKT